MAALLLGVGGMPLSAHLLTLSTHRRRFVLRGDGRAAAAAAFALLPRRCPGFALDCAIVLPDRVYAIVRLPNGSALSSLVQAYKTAATRRIKSTVAIDHVWEKGYAHRVIRDEAELIAVRAALRAYERAT
jgi:REP element-mobilizing transposase RayT